MAPLYTKVVLDIQILTRFNIKYLLYTQTIRNHLSQNLVNLSLRLLYNNKLIIPYIVMFRVFLNIAITDCSQYCSEFITQLLQSGIFPKFLSFHSFYIAI
jgi:hypothetical protein